MRLAIISDIHSNFEALTKTLDLISQLSVDETICLGDIVGYGANPNECVEMVRQHCPIVIRGNHDSAVVNIEITENFTDLARSALFWTRKQLQREHVEFLRTLPIQCSRQNILFVHATPDNPESWDYVFNEWDVQPLFQTFREKICFLGHSHVPGIYSDRGIERSITPDGQYIINVGSVGQPRDGNPQLSFGILDTQVWTYQNVRSSYDVETAARKIVDANLPPALARRLFVGK